MTNRTSRSAWYVLAAALAVLFIGWASPALALIPASVMGTTTTAEPDLDAALKVIFAEPLINNVVSDTELLSVFDTDMNVQEDTTTGGRYIESAHYFQLPAGVGARAENEYIPVPENPVFANSRVYLRKIQGTIEMTGDTMRRVTSNEGAFVDYMERALPDLSTRLVHEIDRMLIGYGAGVRARIAAGGVGAYNAPVAGQWTITVDRSLGVTGFEDPFLHFMEGDALGFTASLAAPIALRNAGSGQSARVVNIDEANNIITVAGTQALHDALAANDYVGSADAAGNSFPFGNPATEREIHGLLGAVDDGSIVATYMNITRASYRLWNSVVVDASVAPFTGAMTEDLLTFADDECAVKGGGKPDVVVMSRSAARGYWKSLRGDRFFLDPRGYQGGKGPLSIILSDRTLQLKVARKLPPQLSFMLQSDTFKRFTLGSWEWDDKTGAIWNRVSDATGRKDAYYAVGNMYEQLFGKAPRKSVRIQGLTKVQ